MGSMIKLAFRNVFRYKRRTLVTFLSVSLGLALLIVSISLLNGSDKQASGNIINSQSSHLVIFHQGYFQNKDDLPMNLLIKDPDKIRSLVTALPAVKMAESRILFAAGLIKGMDELPCLGIAIEPALDPEIFNIKESLVQGEWLEEDEWKMLIGKDLARDAGLSVGDTVTLRVVTSKDREELTWNVIDLDIKGIFDSGNPAVDSQNIYIPIKQARESLVLDAEATEIVVRLHTTLPRDQEILEAQTRIRQVLQTLPGNFEVHTWKDLAGMFLLISQGKSKRAAMIILIMLFIASMGIINTMLMAVLERTREIGMFSALGMKSSQIRGLFILEGGIIGVLGSSLGCILGGLGGWYLEVHGVSIGDLGNSAQKIVASTFPLKDAFYADLSVGVLVLAFVLGTVISLVASVYPAARAAKLDPIDALRHV